MATSRAKERTGIKTSTPMKGFLFSCIACCSAEVLTMPVDVVKTRMQVQGELGAQAVYRGSLHAAQSMARSEGVASLWTGLTPALLRQASYGTLRYGLYEPIKSALAGPDHEGPLPLSTKVLAGTLSGAIGSSLCNPTDLVKVRMQAHRPGPGQAPRYRGTWHAFSSIARTEGVLGLWRGVGPTAGRASTGAAVELATYDEIKQLALARGVPDGIRAHLAASLTAGFLATVINSPFDVVKSRVMNQRVENGRGALYSGMVDCFVKTVRSEGPMALFKGFWPNYARVGPRVVTIFLILEQLRARFD